MSAKSFIYHSIDLLCLFQNFGQQQFDYSNKKNNDGDINDVLYSGGDINLPGSQNKGYQPMARNIGMESTPVVSNEKIERMNQLKQQQKAQYERKRTNLLGGTGTKGAGTSSVLGSVGALTLEQMNLDRRDYTNDFEYDPLNPT